MPTSPRASQEFVPVKEVRDGIVVLRDGSLRSILIASSLNFALKSTDEQTAILLQFQNFLNSLDFPIQLFIQSRQLDIRPYIVLLDERLREQTNDLMKIQVQEYIAFVKSFVESANIMTKSFFIVIPYTPSVATNTRNVLSSLVGGKKKGEGVDQSTFEESRAQLEQRIRVVEQGLSSTGIRVTGLGTEEVIELFYKIFNPGELEKPIALTKTNA